VHDLDSLALHRGANFYVNKVTSQFMDKAANGPTIISITKEASSLYGAADGCIANVADGAGQLITNAANGISQAKDAIASSAETLIAEGAKTLTTYTTKMALVVASFPVDIVKRSAYWFGTYYPIFIKEFTQDLTENSEDKEVREIEESDKSTEANGLKKIEEVLSNMKDKINEVMGDELERPLAEINTFVAEGPHWIQDKAEKVSNETMFNINKYGEKILNDTKKWEEETADEKGLIIGRKKSRKSSKNNC